MEFKKSNYGYPMHHVVLIQKVQSAITNKIPCLYLNVDGNPVLFQGLVEYFEYNFGLSLTWKRTVARAIGMFYDFSIASQKANPSIVKKNRFKLLRDFSISVAVGTNHEQSNIDPLGLYWPPSGVRVAKRYLTALQDFMTWAELEGYYDSALLISFTAPTDESTMVKYLFEANKAKQYSMFSHLMKKETLIRNIAYRENKRVVKFGTKSGGHSFDKAFPSKWIPLLIQQGFVLDEETGKEDLTAKMITVMLLFTGMRESEFCHLWFNDLIPLPRGGLKGFLRDPSDSRCEIIGEESKSRREYLAERRLLPRSDDKNPNWYYAGWKDLKVDSSLSAELFFLHQSAELLLGSMFFTYLNYRESLLQSYKENNDGLDHPFMFVKQKDEPGAPYSIGAYIEALKRAYVRLNRKYNLNIKYGKSYGTTPHGFRHCFARLLKEAGIDEKVIQNCLRQRSIASQEAYTEPTAKLVSEELNKVRNASELVNGIGIF
ncbi:gamma-mobile-trio recombinase GmtY [Psychrobium sp. 1_MG-2023]|uniref:gamma-mobile-trio recombinase GmtY n=1 Tax=Psychrobium sp. 1_MG-2023 TaxID=3062624 RepID=UPI002732AE87|nr:gamma-mobile-trio recombinase GmtY [Psychrobium sp. 1_MG-2023]MDP2562791.1 gamma-mobile-trio recombinase GmtY [Psychrobium sp. 1_MG-2023]